MRAAICNLAPLLAWSIISALVGILLRILEENDTPLSLVTAAVFSAAWSVMTVFVVSVVVFEDVGVVGVVFGGFGLLVGLLAGTVSLGFGAWFARERSDTTADGATG